MTDVKFGVLKALRRIDLHYRAIDDTGSISTKWSLIF